jgi:hypothetical protein
MGKQCDNSNCENCEKWNKEYIAPNKDFHYCDRLERFTRKSFYCSDHENNEEMLDRFDNDRFDEEYS